MKVFLVTSENTDGPEKLQKQMEFLLRVKQAAAVAGITLDVKFDATIHDRSIVANSGWRINLGRGLDIFQFVANDAFDLAVKLQQYRQVKAFGVTYMVTTTRPVSGVPSRRWKRTNTRSITTSSAAPRERSQTRRMAGCRPGQLQPRPKHLFLRRPSHCSRVTASSRRTNAVFRTTLCCSLTSTEQPRLRSSTHTSVSSIRPATSWN